MADDLQERLERFASESKIQGKGALSLMLVVTRRAMGVNGTLDPDCFRAESKGQVAGLGSAAVQSILKTHGITRELAREGGRTSRGNMGKMEGYVAFLNQMRENGILDLEQAEKFWIEEVKKYFNKAGLKLHYDSSKTLRSIFDDLIAQARKLQDSSSGTMYVGSLLHYLVGAKLKMCLDSSVEIRGASVADLSSGTAGDFDVGNVAIHVTVHPGEAVFEKCAANLSNSLRPMVVTIADRIEAARQIASMLGIEDRVEIVDGPQFLAMNLYEKGRFEPGTDKEALFKLVEIYNAEVRGLDSDPALLIS